MSLSGYARSVLDNLLGPSVAQELADALDSATSTTVVQIVQADATFEATTTFSGHAVLSGDVTLPALGTQTAFAGGGQTSATALTKLVNAVTVCATAGDSVKLPSAAAGTACVVSNGGAASMDVFPSSGDAINALAADAALSLPVGASAVFWCADAGVWHSLTGSEASAGDETFAGNNTFTGTNTVSGTLDVTGTLKLPRAGGLTAHAGGGQGSALALTKLINRVATCATAGDSVKLPAAVAGLSCVVSNAGAASMDVFPATGEAINALAVNTALSVPVGATVVFWCATAAVWQSLTGTEAGSGDLSFSGNNTFSATNTFSGTADVTGTLKLPRAGAITAFATGGQASATALTKAVNAVTVCATDGDSVKLPAAVAGAVCEVSNYGAKLLDVFPATGHAINALAANVAVRVNTGTTLLFWCATAGTWTVNVPMPKVAKYTSDATGTQTVPAGLLTGAQLVFATNAHNGADNWTTRTATQMFADAGNVQPGDSYMLVVTNGNAGGAVTLVAGSGVTLTGTATATGLTCRLFQVTFTSATALTIQGVSGGTA